VSRVRRFEIVALLLYLGGLEICRHSLQVSTFSGPFRSPALPFRFGLDRHHSGRVLFYPEAWPSPIYEAKAPGLDFRSADDLISLSLSPVEGSIPEHHPLLTNFPSFFFSTSSKSLRNTAPARLP